MTQTLGEEIIVRIETLRVPEAALVGQPLVLMDWQKREILRIYDNPAGTRRAIISVGRKIWQVLVMRVSYVGAFGGSGGGAEFATLQHRTVTRSGRAALCARRQDRPNVATSA